MCICSFSQAYKTVGGNGERHEDRLATMAVIEKGQRVTHTHKTHAPTPVVTLQIRLQNIHPVASTANCFLLARSIYGIVQEWK